MGSTVERKKFPPDLLDLVFSWSLDDVLNDNLYKDKVEKIPTSFHSVSQYFRSFMFPLLEEARTELSSSVESISSSPVSEVFWIKNNNYNPLTRQQLYDVKVGPWKNRYNASRDETYGPSPGDVLVLSNVKPETVADLSRFGTIYVLASIAKVKDEDGEDDNEHLPDFTVSPSRALDDDGELEKYRHAIFLANITTDSRIWSALGLGRGLASDTNIINRVLDGDSLRADDSCDECPADGLDALASNYRDLNDSQRDAVVDLIATAQCKHRSSVKLIWGPPGTGKTKTLSSLLCTLLTMKHRVLVCAPTNVAITEVASRVLKLIQTSCLTARRTGFSCYSLGDIVLFGNKNRLKVDNSLCDIFIDYRTDRLLRCLSRASGWRHHASSMIQFLESCVYRYHIDRGDATFLDFVTERFSCLAFPLKTCMVSLCTHLTTATISRENFDYIFTLINLLDSFESLVRQANVGDEELVEVFILLEEASGDVVGQSCEPRHATTQSPNGSVLYSAGHQLLHTLRSLCKNVQTPTFQEDNRRVVQSFCLNTASLIFCTASTSFRLYSKKLELAPLNLLVIDEACQLKESESTIPMQLPGIQHAILIGDERQLPAIIKSKVSEGVGFGRSLFERLSALGHPKHLLQIQYRMHPSISLFPNAEFYDGQILDGANVQCPLYEKFYLPGMMYGPFSVINVVDGREEQDDVGHSLKNMVEVAVIFQIIQSLYKASCTEKQKLTIGIISPYAAQVAVIQQKLRNIPTNDDFVLTVKSVDGFQGGEKDVIIISTVRANQNGCIGFLSDCRRANVALTRARHCLWIVGKGATLAKSGSVWESLVHNAKQRACFFDADEDKVLAKTILQIKKELDQMDDLLNSNSSLFRNVLWKVLFSGDFIKSFVEIRSVQLKKGVIHLLLKLASGWRPKRSNAYFTSESSSQRIMQFKIENFCIICTIDIMKYSRYTQVLKIWDILPLSHIQNLVKRLDSIFKTYSDEYVNLCRTKSVDYRNMEVPTTWDTNTSFLKHKILLTEEPTEKLSDCGTIEYVNFVENSKVSESLLLMKFYSLTCGTAKHLLSSTDGKEVDLPFEVTDHERDIILYPQTAFILGRSGTGKTTVLTMKLIKKEQMWYFSSGGQNDLLVENSGSPWRPSEGLVSDENFLRQLFVTVSPKLCSAVSNHIERLKSFLCGGEYSSKTGIDMYDIGDSLHAFSDIPDSFKNITQKHYPLIITFQKFLVMLDGSLGNSFFDKFDDGSELLLKRTGVSRSFALQTLIRKKEVTYPRFLSSYWPHFKTQLTKMLDSSIVFTEIISHVKGDITSNVPFDSWLDREAYVGLSERRASSLNCDAREIIYDIFLAYEKKKLRNREFDISDLVCDLHRRARVYGRNVGVQMDFVYIDEVQDLTMRQISLFNHVCKNFSEGFVFAGDTAQTIARGIDFRFEDIRSLFYTVFLRDPSCDPMKSFKGKSKSISDMFHLNQNFRTHAGVLKLAQSVIDILCFYFPHSLDRLQPETSLIFGEPPILLRSRYDENALMTLFGHSTDSSCSHFNGFGADQVILVRDELSKQKVPEDVRKHALVLTILECKGLEFQDVLVYNFFGDSPLQNHWRVIYDYMNSQCLLDPCTNSFQRFEIAHHNILCSELKQLYVAITRTRQRLWICENHEDYSQPMFDYWNKLGLVKFRWLDSSVAQSMFVASSSEDWRDRGIKLFNEGNYEMATICFEHAGDTFREKWSRASSLRAAAEHIINSDNKNGRRLLIEAAELYESIGKVELEASCYIELNDFQKAGTIYLEKCGNSRLQDAGDCFSQAGCWSLAAKAYAKGNYYSECLSVCSRGNLLDVGLRCIEHWRGCRTSDIIEAGRVHWEEIEFAFLERCAAHYHELKDSKHMMKFVKAFNSISKARSFLKERGYLDELFSMEVELKNFVEAADIAQLNGNLILQADMLEKAGKFEASARVILLYVVMHSLWTTGSNGWPLKEFKQKGDMLKRAKVLTEKSSHSSFESIVLEISILEDTEKGLGDLARILNASQRLKNMKTQVFSSRKILDLHIKSDPSKFHLETEIDDNPERQVTKMLQNVVSSETMVFVWSIWRKNVCSLLDFLGKFDDLPKEGSGRLEVFCMNYFGFHRKYERNYVACNADSLWLRQSDLRSCKRYGKLALVKNDQFVLASERFWVSELVSVGMGVLRCLEELNWFFIRNSIPSGSRGVVLLRIYQLSKFLINFQPTRTKLHFNKLQNTLAETQRSFAGIVFPVDWRPEIKKNAICLREKDLVKELLMEALTDAITGKLTYGKIGRAAMIIMASEKLSKKAYETIMNRLNDMGPWKPFIEHLSRKEPECRNMSLVSSLQAALGSTFLINWQKEVDYISPPCLLYLIEQLLFMVSARGCYFYTTKGSFAEAIGCSDTFFCFNADSYDQVFFMQSFSCFTYLIQQLLFDRPGMIHWIKASKLNANKYYPSMVLKLVVMVVLVYLNSGQLLNILLNVLKHKGIVSVLPGAFRNLLPYVGWDEFHSVFATALMTIGDPLLIVSLTGKPLKFTCGNALFVDMSIARSRQDLMDEVFPKSGASIMLESGSSSIAGASSDYNALETKFASTLEISEKEISSKDEVQNLFSAFDVFLSEQSKTSNDNSIKILAPNLKMEVEKLLPVLNFQVKSLNRSELHDGDEELLLEIQLLIDVLTELSDLLNLSEDELKKNKVLFDELVDELQKRRPRLQYYANLLIRKGVDASGDNSTTAASAKNDLGDNSITAASAKNGLERKTSSNKPKQQKKNKKKPKKGRK